MSDDILAQIGHSNFENDYASDQDFVLSTLESLPGADIELHMGLVSGKVILHRNPIKEFLEGFKNFYGGKGSSMIEGLDDSRKQAIESMVSQAKALGANAIIGLKFENMTITFSSIEVRVYGSAVKFNRY